MLLTPAEDRWNELEPFYSVEPKFQKSKLPEQSIQKMVLTYFANKVKDPHINACASDYLKQHQQLMRDNPLVSPFRVRPNVQVGKKYVTPDLNELIAQVYLWRHSERYIAENWRNAYTVGVLNLLDREPHVVILRSMLHLTTVHVVLGERNAELLRDYFLEKHHADEPQAHFHKATSPFP